MRGTLAIVVCVSLAGVLGGCDGGGGGGGASVDARCRSWCERQNADDDCGPDFSCEASCSSIVLSAGARCEETLHAFFDCTDARSDLCEAGAPMACSAENTAIQMCTAGVGADAGPPTCEIFGTYTGVRGGLSAMACGRTLSPFTSGTLVVTEAADGSALLTITDTSEVGGDTVDCMGTITGCTIEATCESGSDSYVSYDLMFSSVGFYGMASIQVGVCTVPYSIEGRR